MNNYLFINLDLYIINKVGELLLLAFSNYINVIKLNFINRFLLIIN